MGQGLGIGGGAAAGGGGGGNAALTPIMAMIQAMSGGQRAAPAGGGGVPGVGGPAPLVPQAQQPMSFQYKPTFSATPPAKPQLQPNPQVAADLEAKRQMELEQQRLDAMNRQGAQTPYSNQDYNNVGA
jgi:hypothetical protein